MKKSLGLILLFIVCAAVSARELSEGFEGGEIPGDWTVINNDGDDYEWSIYETDSSHSGSYCVRVHYNSTGCDDWLITPPQTVETGDHFSFWAATNSGSYLEDFNVLASTTGTAVEDFDIEIDQVLQTPFDWTLYDYDLTAVPGISEGDQIYLAVQCISVDAWYLYIDDVFVGTSSTEPIIDIDYTSWDAGGVMLGNSADPGNIFQVSNIGGGTLTFSEITGLNGTEFSTDFDLGTELSAGQSYDFGFVYTPVDEGYDEVTCSLVSNGGDPVEIELTGFGLDVKFYESFESNLIPGDWTVYNNDGGDYTWQTASGEASKSGTYGVEKHYEDVSDDWLILPQLTVEDNDVFSFWAAAYHESYPEDFNVMASTGGNEIADFTIQLDEVENTPIEWTLYSYNLTDQPGISYGDQVYLAVQCVSEDAYYLFIDEVMVDVETSTQPEELPVAEIEIRNYPNPFNPSTTFDFTGIRGNTATIEIYNLKGQKIKSIEIGNTLQEGSDQITWDGRDDEGNSVPGGIYFYSINSEGSSSPASKMILLK